MAERKEKVDGERKRERVNEREEERKIGGEGVERNGNDVGRKRKFFPLIFAEDTVVMATCPGINNTEYIYGIVSIKKKKNLRVYVF